MIRFATQKDLPAMVDIIRQSHDHMEFGEFFPEGFQPFDLGTVVDLCRNLMAEPSAAVFVAERDSQVVGCCAVLLTPFTWNAAILSATELFWHMRTDIYPTMTGKRLFVQMLDAMRLWSKAQGAAFFVGITKPGPAGSLLERRGFKPMEMTYGGAL